MTIELIGIAGYARAGKDTAAQYLAMRYSYKRAAFADQIRNALFALNPEIMVSHPQTGEKARMPLQTAVFSFGWEQLKSLSPDVRPLLQRFGTEVGRELWGVDFWVNRLFLENIGERKIVISDVRYWNEAQAIRRKGGEVWVIKRPDGAPANGHPSENDLENYEFDRIFMNDSNEDALFDRIDMALALEQEDM
jgi:hypothetical protein